MHISYILSYASIAFATIVGITLVRDLSSSLRLIVVILIVTSINELCSYLAGFYEMYLLRNPINHICDILLSFLFSLYFIDIIKPVHQRKLIILSAIAWPLIGIVNILFFQPLSRLNSNVLMLECFSFITLSLYFIYLTLKNDRVENIFLYSHFWICILWLILWSSSMFFWSFLNILYDGHWKYMQDAFHVKAIINAVVYSGLAVILFLSGKKVR